MIKEARISKFRVYSEMFRSNIKNMQHNTRAIPKAQILFILNEQLNVANIRSWRKKNARKQKHDLIPCD